MLDINVLIPLFYVAVPIGLTRVTMMPAKSEAKAIVLHKMPAKTVTAAAVAASTTPTMVGATTITVTSKTTPRPVLMTIPASSMKPVDVSSVAGVVGKMSTLRATQITKTDANNARTIVYRGNIGPIRTAGTHTVQLPKVEKTSPAGQPQQQQQQQSQQPQIVQVTGHTVKGKRKPFNILLEHNYA